MADKTKARRWVCPSCGAGKLAPSRPRRDDVRRYCLPCSGRTGRLVERECPANAKERETAQERSRQKAGRRRAAARKVREAAAERARERKLELAPYQAFFRRVLRLRAWEVDLATRPPRYTWGFARGRTTGHANGWSGEVRISGEVAENLETILHELAHSACDRRRVRVEGEPRWHNSVFRRTLADAVEELTGVPVEPSGAATWRTDGAARRAISAWIREPGCWFSRRFFPELIPADAEESGDE